MAFTIPKPIARSARRPDVRAGLIRDHATYVVTGVCVVQSWPFRPLRHARQLARRILRDPVGYLDVIRAVGVPGVDPVASTTPSFPRLAR